MDAQKARAIPVHKAGFAGYVGHEDWEDDEPHNNNLDGFDEDLWDETTPEMTREEQAHYDKHGDPPDGHHMRHERAYTDALDARTRESEPTHIDTPLYDFVSEHHDNSALWQNKGHLGKVSLKGPVYATQSHVGQTHIDRYLDDPKSASWHEQRYGKPSDASNRYLGHDHPMFVTHEGRLHAIEGHHRVAAALQRGDSFIHGWHYDADKHGMPSKWKDED
jgi:hypothetical protein